MNNSTATARNFEKELAEYIMSHFQNYCSLNEEELAEICEYITCELESGEVDFSVESNSLDDGEEHVYRIIQDSEDSIIKIWKRDAERLTRECFPQLFENKSNGIAKYITFDWDQMFKDSLAQSDFGKHFSTYDGSEEYAARTNDDGETVAYYIFRTA